MLAWMLIEWEKGRVSFGWGLVLMILLVGFIVGLWVWTDDV